MVDADRLPELAGLFHELIRLNRFHAVVFADLERFRVPRRRYHHHAIEVMLIQREGVSQEIGVANADRHATDAEPRIASRTFRDGSNVVIGGGPLLRHDAHGFSLVRISCPSSLSSPSRRPSARISRLSTS